MQILSVELENVKSYAKAEITFTHGVNAIVGHNGAGKSTVLEAIGFALFDSIAYNQADFIRGGANFARVTVTFESSADERAYQVVRRIGSSSQYYIFDPEMETRICEGKADVMRFLRTHLNVEPGTDLRALFQDAVGVPQGTLTAAFLLNEGARKKVFDSLLQVEEYQRVFDRLREPVNVLKSRKNDVTLEITTMTTRLERLPELQESVATQARELNEANQELAKSTKALALIQAQRAKQEEARERAVNAERALAEGKQRLAAIQAQLEVAKQAVADAEEAAAVLAANEAGYKQMVAAQAEQQTLDQQVRARQQVEAKRAQADRSAAALQATLAGLEDELKRADAAAKVVASLEADVAQQTLLEEQLAHAKTQRARLEDAKQRAAEAAKQVRRLTEQLSNLAGQLAQAKTLQDEQRALQQERDVLTTQARDQRDSMSTLASRAEIIKEQTKQLESVNTAHCPVCEQPLTPAHRKTMLARNQKQLDGLRAEWREASARVKASEERLAAMQNRLNELQQTLLRLPRAEEQAQTEALLAQSREAQEQAQAQADQLDGVAGKEAALTQALQALGDPRSRYNVAREQAARKPEIEARLDKARKDVDALNETLAQLQQEVAAFGDLDAKLDAVNATLRAHEAAYQAYLGSRRQAAELGPRRERMQALGEEVSTLQNTVQALDARHKEAVKGFDAGAYAAVVEQERTLQETLGGLRARIKLLTENKARGEAEIEALEALKVHLQEAQARLDKLNETEEALELIRRLLRQAGPYITETLVRQISDGAGQIFSDLMQDYSRHLSWNKDYSITLEVDGHERQFSQLSGGEQMSAALAVRLALLREMSSIDIAFFDEPTANLDETRREALARQILQVRGFRQLFVISHDDTFEQATQNLIRVDRQGGTSRVSYG